LSYISTCAAATNAQVQCTSITISASEEACKCTYLSGAGTISWTVPNNVTQLQVLIVGGGGSGGGGSPGLRPSGGGGAGGILYGTLTDLSSTYTVIIGKGGAAVGNATTGNNGGNSSFGAHVAYGGGGGAGDNTNANNGGSGGGGGYNGSYGLATQTNSGTLTGYGNRGGRNGVPPVSYGGPGGSSGGVSDDRSVPGPGLSFSITGSSATYAVGGYQAAQNTQPGTGNGGNNGPDPVYGYEGSSGVVIIRYTHP